MDYEMVAGIEIHVELSTESKVFCSCPTKFAAPPNTQCCPVCTGQPGALPVLNAKAVDWCILAGLATGCAIAEYSAMARKNYFYPDLPKAYQISQHESPICTGGSVELPGGRRIRIERIHLEEDAGKLIRGGDRLYIDYNRAGVPLIEIVSMPDIRSAVEAAQYVSLIQTTMRSIGISDVRMQEGSLRCDVNISVRPEGSRELGVRTEIKNMNSITMMQRAIDFEFSRQCAVIGAGGKVLQQTLRYDARSGRTEPMRGKENSEDYRYFPEPDILPFYIDREHVEALRAGLPEGVEARKRRYETDFGLTSDEAGLIVRYPRVARYFEDAAAGLKHPRAAAGFIIGPMYRKYPLQREREDFSPSVEAGRLNMLCRLTEEGKIPGYAAKQIFERMLEGEQVDLSAVAQRDGEGLAAQDVERLCREAIEASPAAVKDYRRGKLRAAGAIVGAAMRQSRGRADPQLVRETVLRLLEDGAGRDIKQI